MKRRVYFVSAIVIAVLLPVIFGGVYFLDIFNEKSATSSLAKVVTRPEISYNANEVIDGLEDVFIKEGDIDSAECYEFSVSYNASKKANYNLYLNNISVSDNIDLKYFKWHLLLFSTTLGDYQELTSGDMSSMRNGEMLLVPNMDITNKREQKFKLCYYLTKSEENMDLRGTKFKSNIKIE